MVRHLKNVMPTLFKEAKSQEKVILVHPTNTKKPVFFSQCPECDSWIECRFINDIKLDLVQHAVSDRAGTPIPSDA